MDLVFARCVDHLSLSGPSGATLLQTATAASSDLPRPALLRFLAFQFRRRPALFSSPDWTQPPPTLHLIASDSLRRRALGYSIAEHPALPEQACRLLQHVGRSGPAGILQSELANLLSLSPVMVSHYLGSLTARRLVARKRVVLTTTKPATATSTPTQSTDPALSHHHGPEFITPRDPTTRITATTVIVLARFASVLASSNASKRITGARGQLPPPLLDGSAYPSHPAASDADPDVSIHELNVNQGADRVLTALRHHPHIRTQKDLKVIAMPDHERPPGCTVEMYQRRRHRAFRAFRLRLQRANLVAILDRECVDVNGNSRGTHTCLKLVNAPQPQRDEEHIVAPLVVENEEAVAAVEDIDTDDEIEQAPAAMPSPNTPVNQSPPAPQGSQAGFLAEVDLIQQVYSLLHSSGAEGRSVPELSAMLDDGTKLTSAPQKRIRNIINGMSRFVPIAESQKFQGSAMCLKNVLAEFSDKNMATFDQEQGQGSAAKLISTARVQRKSNLARRKDELTSLGVQRQELVLQLLNEDKAIVLETLGRRVALREKDSSVDRVDQKVMRRIINDLVLQKRVQVLTTLRPSISKRSQTVRLATLPRLKADSPEVAHAISMLVSQSIHGKQATSSTPRKRKAEDDIVQDESNMSEVVVSEKTPKRKRAKSQHAKRPKSAAKKLQTPTQDSTRDENIADDREIDTQQSTTKPNGLPGKPEKNTVVVHKERRDTRNARIGRLTAIDYGWMKGKLARVRKFHEHLYQVVCKRNAEEHSDSHAPHHITIETSKATLALGTFTIQSCLLEMSVGDYAAVVGIYYDHGDILEAIENKKISEVEDIMHKDITSLHAGRQLTSLVQCLVKLELMESSQEGKFALCGAGIIRDFGKGIPTGVLPHGILFSSKAAVEMYWKEVQQFSYFRYQKQPADPGHVEHTNEQVEETSEHALADVYIRVRWNRGFAYTFTRDEQFQYEVLLQRMSGVKVEKDGTGAIQSSNFASYPLERFAVGQLIDMVQNFATELGQKISREKNTILTEKLLFYSRFRSRHEAPEAVCENSQSRDTPASDKVSTDPRHNIGIFLRLSRGCSSVNRSAVTREEPKRLVRRPKPKIVRALKKRKLTEREPRTKTVVQLERFIIALREVLQSRTMIYCKDIDLVPRWNVTGLFSNSKTVPAASIDSRTPTPRRLEIPTSQQKGGSDSKASGQKSNCPNGLDTNASENDTPVDMARHKDNAPADETTTDEAAGTQENDKDGAAAEEKSRETMVFREATLTLCQAQIIQSIVDIIALRLALQLRSEQADATSEVVQSKLHAELENSWDHDKRTLRAAVIECQAELYRNHKVVFDEDSILPSRRERLSLIEKEFRLTTNMRMGYEYKPSEQLSLLAARYRRIAGLGAKGVLWREFVFRDNNVDEVMSVGETDAKPVRVEVMEQVLLSIVNDGRQTQKSSYVMSMLSRFRPEDIAKARDRMLLREAISITTTDTMEQFFTIFKGRQARGEIAARPVLQKQSGKALLWVNGLQQSSVRETEEGYSKIRETELGKDTSGRRCLESRKAAMAMTQMMFFPLRGEGRLRLMPHFELGDGHDVSTVMGGEPGEGHKEQENNNEQDGESRDKEGNEEQDEESRDKEKGGLNATDKEKEYEGINKKDKSAEDSSDEDAKTEDDPADGKSSASRTMIDVRFKYESAEAGLKEAHVHKSDKGNELSTLAEEVGAEGDSLQNRVEEVVRKGEYMGVTLRELLSSEVAQKCADKSRLAHAMHYLLREGRAYRLSIETPGYPWLPGSRWDSSKGVLYLHASFISPLVVQSDSTVMVKEGVVVSRLVCVWSTFQGRGCEELVQNVTRSVLHQVTRKPGMEVTSVIRVVQGGYPALPARAVTDLLFVLERKGMLTVTRVVKRKGGGGGGPFGKGSMARVKKEEKEERKICCQLVDGRAFVGKEEEFEEGFLHLVPGMAFTEVGAEELCEIGRRLW